jgi:hypothetical protein
MLVRSFVLFLFIISSFLLRAGEGMWVPLFLEKLNADEMRALGMRITPEDIFSFEKASLKDAVVIFGGGCTGEMLSAKGLLMTNHHCGYGQIQSHSTVENDLLTKGFWAMSANEELTNPGLKVTFIRYMEDVTDRILNDNVIGENVQKLIREYANEYPNYEFEVKPFYYGNQYIIIGKESFRDVRLVGAPPSAIGKYGSDTDNWMWPRHTGDFMFFRVYADKDNNPADYSPDNVPYEPRKHMSVSAKGVKEGDFTMVFGFPGSTQQYLPAREIQNITQIYNPERIEVRDLLLGNLNRRMRESDEVRIQYAAKYARIANAWKKWRGENIGIRESRGIERKEENEFEFRRRLLSNPQWSQDYGYVLDSLNHLYSSIVPYSRVRNYFIEVGIQGVEFLNIMRDVVSLTKQAESGKITEDVWREKIEAAFGKMKKDYSLEADQEAFATLMPLYIRRLAELTPKRIQALDDRNKGDWEAIAEAAFSDKFFERFVQGFNEKTKLKAFAKAMRRNALYEVSDAMVQNYFTVVAPKWNELNARIQEHQKTYMEALMTVFSEKRFYPDANFTLRVAYGQVEGFAPLDAVQYHWQTTDLGILQKYVPGDYEFDLPLDLVDLLRKEDFGKYADEDGRLPVCFVASNHTTGGNSGSPVLNADGHLIGINFDRAWEGTMSDLNYDISRCRNIMVDARYILWVVDVYAGAGYLLDEMDIIWE